MYLDKRKITIAACAIGTLATVGVAHSQMSSGRPQKMMKSKQQIVTLDVRSEAAAKRLVAYLKGSRASYYLLQGKKGKSTKLVSGSVGMSDLKIIWSKMPKWHTPGQGGDGPIATNANNGEFADAGHIATIVWGANAAAVFEHLGAVFQKVDKGLYRVDAFNKGTGAGILGKKIGSIGAGGL